MWILFSCCLIPVIILIAYAVKERKPIGYIAGCLLLPVLVLGALVWEVIDDIRS